MINYELLRTIKYSVFKGDCPEIEDAPALLKDIKRHAVMPLISEEVFKDDIDASAQIKKARSANLYNFIKHSNAIKELNRIFYPYKPVILKGFSAGRYYSEIALRTVGDIDFMLPGLDFDKAVSIMADNGYECTDTVSDEISPRHKSYDKGNVHFEMHRYFSRNETEKDKALDKILASTQPVKITTKNAEFYTFPDIKNGLVLIEHIKHHIISGMGLRQIIDWAVYVQNVFDDEAKENEFLKLAKELGLENLAVYATRLCEIYFGIKEHEFSKDANDDTVVTLMEEIFESGNFGRSRDKLTSKAVTFLESENIFARLKKGGMCRWKFAQNHKWARPFAPFYQIGFIIVYTVKSLISGNKFKGVRQIRSKHDILISELGLREKE